MIPTFTTTKAEDIMSQDEEKVKTLLRQWHIAEELQQWRLADELLAIIEKEDK
jgi:hypothetical protein